jgi:hypothetical protein
MLVDGKQIAVAMAFVRPVSISRSEAVQSIQSDGKVIAKDGILVKLGKPPTGCINAEAPCQQSRKASYCKGDRRRKTGGASSPSCMTGISATLPVSSWCRRHFPAHVYKRLNRLCHNKRAKVFIGAAAGRIAFCVTSQTLSNRATHQTSATT